MVCGVYTGIDLIYGRWLLCTCILGGVGLVCWDLLWVCWDCCTQGVSLQSVGGGGGK